MPTATKTVTFVTGPHHDLRLVEQARHDAVYDALGRQVTPQINGRAIQFEHGQFQTDDPDVIEWLRNHPRNGTDLTSGGFEELGEPLVNASSRVTTAAMAGDVDTLEEILDEEERLHKRPEIIEPVRAALSRIAQAEIDAEEAAEEGARKAAVTKRRSPKPVVEDVTPRAPAGEPAAPGEEESSTSPPSKPS